MTAKTVKLTVRLPEELYLQLVALASDDHRSLNSTMLRLVRLATDANYRRRVLEGLGYKLPKFNGA